MKKKKYWRSTGAVNTEESWERGKNTILKKEEDIVIWLKFRPLEKT
jgi:hypothetical protein